MKSDQKNRVAVGILHVIKPSPREQSRLPQSEPEPTCLALTQPGVTVLCANVRALSPPGAMQVGQSSRIFDDCACWPLVMRVYRSAEQT